MGPMLSLFAPTWRKFLSVVVASLATLFLAAAPLGAATLRDVFKRASPSVVVIRVPGEVGSDTLTDAKGLVLTASHVVEVAQKITVEFLDGAAVSAHVLYSEPAADVALLQLTTVPPEAVPAPLGDSGTMEVGDEILVIGAPMGVNHILTKSGGSEGLGFAVTVNTAKRLLLQQKGFWIGTEGYVLQGEVATIFNLPQPAGYAIKRVAPDSPAAKIGLRTSAGEVAYKERRFLWVVTSFSPWGASRSARRIILPCGTTCGP
jgi:serine protease Do